MKRYVKSSSGVYFYAGFMIEHDANGYVVSLNDRLLAGPFESAEDAEDWCEDNEKKFFK